MLSKTFKNNESLDCPICYNETNGIKMDCHTYQKYAILWKNTDTNE